MVSTSPSKDQIMENPLWFDLRVFYVRISNYDVKASTPDNLTLNLRNSSSSTVLEINGKSRKSCSENLSSTLRRDRADKRTEEATFVCTDKIKMNGSLGFDISLDSDVLFCGNLEISEESTDSVKEWRIGCLEILKDGERFLKGKREMGFEGGIPAVDVYVAGCFSGFPVILVKTVDLGFAPSSWMEGSPDEFKWNTSYRDHTTERGLPSNYDNLYLEGKHDQEDDVELSWFNSGVRVGVGIGLGVSLGVGISLGLLVRGYNTTLGRLGKL